MTMLGGGTMGGTMKPWLHFTEGENLFFMSWVPLSTGAVIGACIGLFMLALVERWVASMRGIMEGYWVQKMNEKSLIQVVLPANDFSLHEKSLQLEYNGPSPPRPVVRARVNSLASLRRAYPFILSHEVARGFTHACQSALGYSLMLAVMTFHAGYIISIIVGLGVGEVLFGRYASNVHHA